MIIRMLKRQEAKESRALWEQVFTEDGAAFLDYYYDVKTKNNWIYVVESESAIRSMVHLNPFELSVEQNEVDSCYVVAVATDPGYRKRGHMSELLKKSIRDMYRSGIPFTFLMPADEKIYYPHHFRMVYDQWQWKAVTSDNEDVVLERLLEKQKENIVRIRKASLDDCKNMALFAESVLKHTQQVYVKRDWQYYGQLLQEQESQNGGILIAEYAGQIKGMLLYDTWDGFMVREPLVSSDDEDIFERAGLILQKEEKKPMIMVRVLCVEKLLECMKCKEETEFYFELVDPVVSENNKIYLVRGNEERVMVRTKPVVKGRYNDLQKISIGALTSILFGYKRLEKIEEEEQEYFSLEFKESVKKLKPLKQFFINEIV